MTAYLIIGALSTATGMAWLIREALTAPYGWEDERTMTFHFGFPEEHEIHFNHEDDNA